MNYSFDIVKIIDQLLPTFLRTQKRKDWLRSIIMPVATLHNYFLSYVSEVRDLIALNGQKLTIEWHLNNLYDGDERRIYVEYADEEQLDVDLYLISESQTDQPLFLISESPSGDGELDLFLLSEADQENDFIIHAPDVALPSLAHQQAVTAIVNKIKEGSKRFSIQLFTP